MYGRGMREWITLGAAVLAGLLLAAVIPACSGHITRRELLKEMQEGTAPLIVDVRSRGEYDRDRVPGAVHIPFYAIGSGLTELGYRKQDPVVLYCEHGPRAYLAGFALSLEGFDRVLTLDGHMKGWRNHDFPLERQLSAEQPGRAVHGTAAAVSLPADRSDQKP